MADGHKGCAEFDNKILAVVYTNLVVVVNLCVCSQLNHANFWVYEH